MTNELIWVESFRPRSLNECILPERIKSSFRKMIETNNIQNYAAVGNAGSGKTSSARALCEQLNIEYIVINMSNESGIDTVRTKIVNFASSMSFTSTYKVIILDEFDYANWVKYDLTFRGDNFFLYLHHYYSSKEYTIFYEEKDKMIKSDFLFSFVVDETNIPKELRMFLIFLSENLEDLEKLLFVNTDFKKNSQQKLYKKFIKDNFTKSVF